MTIQKDMSMRKLKFYITLSSLFFILCLSETPLMAKNGISLNNTWIREAPPTVSILAAYVDITNHSEKDITLIKVISPDFERIEIHLSQTNEHGMVSMEKQDNLIIKAGKTIKLKPGGYHLMLFKPKTEKRSGDKVNLTFHFTDDQLFSIETTVEKHYKKQQKHHH